MKFMLLLFISDTLWNRFGRQCCGGKVIPDTATCCGDLTSGQDHLPKPGFSCCGQEYVNSSTTLCCVSDTGHSRVSINNVARFKGFLTVLDI